MDCVTYNLLRKYMDWYELILVIIGAVLCFALSIVTTLVNKAMDKYGKLHLFYKFVYSKETARKAGIKSNVGGKYILIPVYFEFQNTANTTRVIRDVCLYLYNDGKRVGKMIQVQYSKSKRTQDGEIVEETVRNYGGDKNSYSLVLPPLSIQKLECEFLYKVAISEIEDYAFDEIRFSYFDEKNSIMECVLCKVEHGWQSIDFKYENDYSELICSKVKSKR